MEGRVEGWHRMRRRLGAVGREVVVGMERVGDWVFEAGAAGELVWASAEELSGDEVWAEEICLEVMLGGWPCDGPVGPVVRLMEPTALCRAADLGSRRANPPCWRVTGVGTGGEWSSGSGMEREFGAEWLVEFARCAAPGVVYWRCPVKERVRWEARLRRVASRLRGGRSVRVVGGERRGGAGDPVR